MYHLTVSFEFLMKYLLMVQVRLLKVLSRYQGYFLFEVIHLMMVVKAQVFLKVFVLKILD